jgi:hypothetical protein
LTRRDCVAAKLFGRVIHRPGRANFPNPVLHERDLLDGFFNGAIGDEATRLPLGVPATSLATIQRLMNPKSTWHGLRT